MRSAAALLAVLAVGCGDAPVPPVDAAPTASELASASAPARRSADPLVDFSELPVELPPTRASPLGSTTTPEQRTDAVLALLAGGEPATRLPIRATGQGKDFDHALRDKVAPRSSSRPPSVRLGATNVSDGLPKEVVQRIVRQSFGRFRLCYENGLRSSPTIAGRVEVRFSITKEGAVTSTKATSTQLPASVVSCVEKTFYGLSFPQPEAGKTVQVLYPITFAPR